VRSPGTRRISEASLLVPDAAREDRPAPHARAHPRPVHPAARAAARPLSAGQRLTNHACRCRAARGGRRRSPVAQQRVRFAAVLRRHCVQCAAMHRLARGGRATADPPRPLVFSRRSVSVPQRLLRGLQAYHLAPGDADAPPPEASKKDKKARTSRATLRPARASRRTARAGRHQPGGRGARAQQGRGASVTACIKASAVVLGGKQEREGSGLTQRCRFIARRLARTWARSA